MNPGFFYCYFKLTYSVTVDLVTDNITKNTKEPFILSYLTGV